MECAAAAALRFPASVNKQSGTAAPRSRSLNHRLHRRTQMSGGRQIPILGKKPCAKFQTLERKRQLDMVRRCGGALLDPRPANKKRRSTAALQKKPRCTALPNSTHPSEFHSQPKSCDYHPIRGDSLFVAITPKWTNPTKIRQSLVGSEEERCTVKMWQRVSVGIALRFAFVFLICLPACKAETRPQVTSLLGLHIQGQSKSNLLNSFRLHLAQQDVRTIYWTSERQNSYVVSKYRGHDWLEITTKKELTNNEERIIGVCVNCLTGGSVTNALNKDEVASMSTPEKVRELEGVAPFMEMRGEIWHEVNYEHGFEGGAKYMFCRGRLCLFSIYIKE